MRPWRNQTIGIALALLAWGCGMAETTVFQPKPLDTLKTASASAASKGLEAEVTAFLRDKYTIKSSQYFEAPAEIPWIAISKNVQNQMAAKSIERVMFDWYEPGLDFVEVYPQGENAFAVAMPKSHKSDAPKLIGFYVLSGSAKK